MTLCTPENPKDLKPRQHKPGRPLRQRQLQAPHSENSGRIFSPARNVERNLRLWHRVEGLAGQQQVIQVVVVRSFAGVRNLKGWFPMARRRFRHAVAPTAANLVLEGHGHVLFVFAVVVFCNGDADAAAAAARVDGGGLVVVDGFESPACPSRYSTRAVAAGQRTAPVVPTAKRPATVLLQHAT